MVRIKVSLKNGTKKLVAVENKKKCAQWLNLLHEPWVHIELGYEGKKDHLESRLDLQEWVLKNG